MNPDTPATAFANTLGQCSATTLVPIYASNLGAGFILASLRRHDKPFKPKRVPYLEISSSVI
jgi:hypothetical protein